MQKQTFVSVRKKQSSIGSNLPFHRSLELLPKHGAQTKKHVQVLIASFFLTAIQRTTPTRFQRSRGKMNCGVSGWIFFGPGGWKVKGDNFPSNLCVPGTKKTECLLKEWDWWNEVNEFVLFVWWKNGWTEPESNLSDPLIPVFTVSPHIYISSRGILYSLACTGIASTKTTQVLLQNCAFWPRGMFILSSSTYFVFLINHRVW